MANFSSIKEYIYFSVEGNASSIGLYIYVHEMFTSYVVNTFYATFSTSDLELVPDKQFLQKHQLQYIKFSTDVELYDTGEFSKG